MNESEFAKRLDDTLREELTLLGYEYREVVASLEEARQGGGVTVRMHPPYDDFTIDEPQSDLTRDVFSARLRRRLRTVLEAPGREPAPAEDL